MAVGVAYVAVAVVLSALAPTAAGPDQGVALGSRLLLLSAVGYGVVLLRRSRNRT